MTIKELIEKRATAWEAAKAFLESHRGENGVLSAEDSETYDRMEKDVTDLTKEIERKNREIKTGRASDQYRRDMITAMRTGFRKISNVLEEGTDANGGYLVPAEWDSRLIDVLTEENIFRALATTITTSGEHKINIAGTKPAAAWIEERPSTRSFWTHTSCMWR